MGLATILGVLGHLSAFLLPVLALYLFVVEFNSSILIIFVLAGVLRGIFRYSEQYLNHYIAFTILARLRATIFEKLRSLDEKSDHADYFTLVSSDIELLEVFFAHTLSPIMIALIFNIIVLSLLAYINPIYALIALTSYLLLAIGIPFVFGKIGHKPGRSYRQGISELNSLSLEGIRGWKELKNFHQERTFIQNLREQGNAILVDQKKLKIQAGLNRALCDGLVLSSGLVLVLVGLKLQLPILFAFTILMSSFGPSLALSQLTNNLNLTTASAQRTFELLDAEPLLLPISGKEDITFENISIQNVSFAYDNNPILENLSLDITKGKIIGIKGASGSGKSTLLKLLMRLHAVDSGTILISDRSIEDINSSNLKDIESVMFQSTAIFQGSFADNIRIAKKGASDAEIVTVMKQAQLHEFIPTRNNPTLESQGRNISSGEAQRIGLARIFLHSGELIILDEPTANLDSLNEAMILQALRKHQNNRTLIIVSHRDSTLKFADCIYQMSDINNLSLME